MASALPERSPGIAEALAESPSKKFLDFEPCCKKYMATSNLLYFSVFIISKKNDPFISLAKMVSSQELTQFDG